jgi:hypothetical protein
VCAVIPLLCGHEKVKTFSKINECCFGISTLNVTTCVQQTSYTTNAMKPV